ncbi:FecR domain-containing protein [Rufibacter sediminis]|uniref:FecR domain-containing protein n=1 Tax=Rufibacter sediminis TaxID=2762756 RepID=A0ABR6VU85_9BACT|nr:FecR family protein [Rufibacter sediminis]MBC3540762.1 FecR domain-containing protein [Rufibacter sediminis]
MDQHLLNRFYNGACTPEEVKTVLEWFKNQNLTPEQERQLEQWWAQAGERQTETAATHDADKTWSKLAALIQEESTGIQRETKVLPLPASTWRNWTKVAAAVLLPLGLIWFVASQYFQQESAAGKMMAVHTAPGEWKTIQLEDGSSVVLRPGSKVTYLVPFAQHRRDITLEGEAFFQVAKDKNRPFVVKSGAISTQALGTSFNIRYQPKDTAISVALATGLVKISKGEAKEEATLANLEPGQQLVFNRKNQQHAVAAYERQEVLGWKDGVLYFKKASLEEVVDKIENWYGVRIEVAGATPANLEEWSYTGEYRQQSLPQVLEGISFVKQFTYEMNQNQVRITFKRP